MYRPFLELKPLEERKSGQGLFIDSVSLENIAALNISPVYVTSLNAVGERVKLYQNTISSFFKNNDIFYAMKANFSEPILREIKEQGAGIDIVSIGEWRSARKAGIASQKICFSGVGKKENEWKETINEGLGFINVEHLSELESVLNFLFTKQGHKPVVSLRVNPCLDIKTHPHLKTGALDSKFGILFEHFVAWFNEKKIQYANETEFLKWLLPLHGIHIHIGSQLVQQEIFGYVVQKILDCASFMQKNGVNINHINFGGGLGVPVEGVPLNGSDIKNHVSFICSTFQSMAQKYPELLELWTGNVTSQKPASGEALQASVSAMLPDFNNLFVCFEPGRSIVASSTVFLTSVLYEKKNSADHLFCYVDGAMNDFPRPSLYGAVHHAEIVDFAHADEEKTSARLRNDLFHWKVVGPVCESGDFLSQDCLLPQVKKGDMLAFFEAGAYCRSMASQYNLRPLPSEIFVKNGKISCHIENH